MRYRDNRHHCHRATAFLVGGRQRGGTILNVSRSGVLAFLGSGLRIGQKVTFTLNGNERAARIVRIDDHAHAGLRLEFPLTRSEMRDIVGASAFDRRSRENRATELS